MPETLTTIQNKTVVTSVEVISTLLRVLIAEGYNFNTTKEIQTVIRNKFNTEVNIDSIEELFYSGGQFEDKVLIYKNLGYTNY